MRSGSSLALALVLLAVPAAAQVRTAPINAREPIEIAADALEVQQDKRTATFNGNVNATQGTLVMRADRLVVTYTQGGTPGGDANAISKLDAVGKVFLSTPGETAQGNNATYDVPAGIITLTGSVVLTQGQNVLRGERAVLNLATGNSRVEGAPAGAGGDGRVRVVIDPNQPAAPAAPAAAGNAKGGTTAPAVVPKAPTAAAPKATPK
jgi:lipopolysaccharide export system protein LptA